MLGVNEMQQPGARLRARLTANWPPITQAQLARRLDIKESIFSRYMTGDRKVPADLWARCAAVLGCHVSEIAPEEEVAA